MSMHLLPLLACLAVNNPNPWQQASQKKDITVWTREVPDSALREVKAVSIIPVAPEQLWSVIVDTEHYTDFMPYVEAAHRIDGPDASERYEYQRLSPPWVKKRDYVLKTRSEVDTKAGTWLHTWVAVPNIGPPPRDDAVRVTVVDGSWMLRRLDTGHTYLTYRLFTDPGGSVPRWVANRANSQSIPDLLEAVKRRALDPTYKR